MLLTFILMLLLTFIMIIIIICWVESLIYPALATVLWVLCVVAMIYLIDIYRETKLREVELQQKIADCEAKGTIYLDQVVKYTKDLKQILS